MSLRTDGATEGAFQVAKKQRKTENKLEWKPATDRSNKNYSKSVPAPQKGRFPPCSICKKTNHTKKYCWSKNKPSVQCHFCKNYGHIARNCKKKKLPQQQQPQQQANVIEESKVRRELAFMMSQTMDVAELHTWLIDSGCTSHMTKHL